MALSSTERLEAGQVVDSYGRPLFKVVTPDAPIELGDHKAGGYPVDADGREIIALKGTAALLPPGAVAVFFWRLGEDEPVDMPVGSLMLKQVEGGIEFYEITE